MNGIQRTVPVFVPESLHHGPWAGYATLAYRPADPFAVHLLIDGRPWALLRDLLAKGLYRPVGIGDVRVQPLSGKGERRIEVVLSSDDGRAVLWFTRRDVADLLEASYKVVPRGGEFRHVDWDATVAALLSKDGSR